uniref:Uncharacterized protein n=1 Tax=Bionectria ochroleuca TaxID=29856 RepID=A0A0B7KLM7_BIOOC
MMKEHAFPDFKLSTWEIKLRDKLGLRKNRCIRLNLQGGHFRDTGDSTHIHGIHCHEIISKRNRYEHPLSDVGKLRSPFHF